MCLQLFLELIVTKITIINPLNIHWLFLNMYECHFKTNLKSLSFKIHFLWPFSWRLFQILLTVLIRQFIKIHTNYTISGKIQILLISMSFELASWNFAGYLRYTLLTTNQNCSAHLNSKLKLQLAGTFSPLPVWATDSGFRRK